MTSSAEGPASTPWPCPSTIRSSSWEAPERVSPTTGPDSDWNWAGQGPESGGPGPSTDLRPHPPGLSVPGRHGLCGLQDGKGPRVCAQAGPLPPSPPPGQGAAVLRLAGGACAPSHPASAPPCELSALGASVHPSTGEPPEELWGQTQHPGLQGASPGAFLVLNGTSGSKDSGGNAVSHGDPEGMPHRGASRCGDA